MSVKHKYLIHIQRLKLNKDIMLQYSACQKEVLRTAFD